MQDLDNIQHNMATLSITVNADATASETFVVRSEQSNSCITVWELDTTPYMTIGDTLRVFATNVTGTYILSSNDGNYVYDTNYTTTVANVFTLRIGNSGSAGVYYSATITVSNISTGAATEMTFTRFNDSAAC